jgi:glucan biosynthesis protein
MSSLFQGSPQTATSYTTSSTETPKWMQDAIYNQIQVAQNIANKPYQAYDMPTVAELSPLQQQAYKQVQDNQGFYQADLDKAQADMYGFGAPTMSNLPASSKYP